MQNNRNPHDQTTLWLTISRTKITLHGKRVDARIGDVVVATPNEIPKELWSKNLQALLPERAGVELRHPRRLKPELVSIATAAGMTATAARRTRKAELPDRIIEAVYGPLTP